MLTQHPCRFIVRDFKYSEDAIEEQKRELQEMDASEKELWVRDGRMFSKSRIYVC